MLILIHGRSKLKQRNDAFIYLIKKKKCIHDKTLTWIEGDMMNTIYIYVRGFVQICVFKDGHVHGCLCFSVFFFE